jgi:hypothetical protein
VPPELQRYRLDGAPMAFLDGSLGELDNFVRKVRTQARVDGTTLTLETEPWSESIDRATGATSRAGGSARNPVRSRSSARPLSASRSRSTLVMPRLVRAMRWGGGVGWLGVGVSASIAMLGAWAFTKLAGVGVAEPPDRSDSDA